MEKQDFSQSWHLRFKTFGTRYCTPQWKLFDSLPGFSDIAISFAKLLCSRFGP